MPKDDFPAISDGKRNPKGPPLDEVEPGTPAEWEETLYEDTGGDWKKGERGGPIGSVKLTHSRTTEQGPLHVRAEFEFKGVGTVEYEGPVPGEAAWRGTGRLTFVRGTRKFADPERKPNLDVESTNPKRWG